MNQRNKKKLNRAQGLLDNENRAKSYKSSNIRNYEAEEDEPIPGGKVGARRGHLTELTSAQQTWLITYFPIAADKVLFTTMGISREVAKRFAVRLRSS